MDVHLRELRSFVAVAEHLHFTHAAQTLFVSQPALSKQIRALEAQVRTPLFQRDRRSVALTAAGEALLPGARAVLEAWEQASAAAAAVSATSAGTVVVGMSTAPVRGLLPAVRARLAHLDPDARLQVRQVTWADATAGLADPDQPTDAALVWLPLPDPERYGWITVTTEPRVLAMAAEHHLARRPMVDFADLLDEPFLALPRQSEVAREYWLATDARDGRPAVIGAEIASSEETVEALSAGLGICLLAAGNAPLITRDGITTRPVTGVSDSHLVLAWRTDNHSPLLERLRTSVTAVVRSTTPVDP